MTSARQAMLQVFSGPGAAELLWTPVDRRCDCITADSHQPRFDHALCGGTGVLRAQPRLVRGLFRSQGRWTSWQMVGEFALGEAELTLPAFDGPDGSGIVACKPAYLDHRTRDTFATPAAHDDGPEGRTFFPAASPVPFLFGGEHVAWRVQLQSLARSQQTTLQA